MGGPRQGKSLTAISEERPLERTAAGTRWRDLGGAGG